LFSLVFRNTGTAFPIVLLAHESATDVTKDGFAARLGSSVCCEGKILYQARSCLNRVMRS
jgi:hypothetical protein